VKRQLARTAPAPNIGTDIWLIDNKLDKVYKYTGAASRLSGSQSAASSFSLDCAQLRRAGFPTRPSSQKPLIWAG